MGLWCITLAWANDQEEIAFAVHFQLPENGRFVEPPHGFEDAFWQELTEGKKRNGLGGMRSRVKF